MKHSSSDATAVAGTFSYGSATNAGSYTATWSFTPTDTTNYNSTNGNVGTVTVNKATGSVTIGAYTNIIYDGSQHTLAHVSGNTGTMHFRLGTNGSWSTNIPNGSSVGDYVIYWYMDESTNYYGLGSSSSPYAYVTARIKTNFKPSGSDAFKTSDGKYFEHK
jgi:hypothetical protein